MNKTDQTSNQNGLLKKRQKVLIVDAGDDFFSALQSFQNKIDADLIKVDNGEEAWTAIQEHDFSLIVMDAEISDIGGYELSDIFSDRSDSHETPILFLTADHPDKGAIPEGSKSIDFIPKSYPPEMMAAKMVMLLDLDRAHRDLQQLYKQRETGQGAVPEKNNVQTREELDFEHKFLKSFMDLLPLCAYFKDLNSRFVNSNREHVAYMGVESEEDLRGKSDFDFFPQEAAQIRYDQEQQIIKTGNPIQLEERGRDQWTMTIKAPWYNMSGEIKGTFGFSLNITEKKEALRRIESTFRAAPTGIGMTHSCIIKEANDHLCEMVGYPEKELIGQSLRVFYQSDEEFDRIAPAERGISQQCQTGTIETIWCRKDGTLINVLLGLTPLDQDDFAKGITFTALDITEKKRAERELEESRRLLQSILNTIPTRVFWKDRESRFIGCNKSFATDTGYNDPKELIGKTDFDLSWTKEQSEQFRTDDRAVIEQNLPKLNFEETCTLADGILHWVRCSKLPLKDANNKVVGVLGTYEDISDQKRMKEAIEKRVLALTQPMESTEQIAVEELFDIEALQRLQDEFSDATGVASIISTPNGKPITQPSHFSHLCRDIIRSTEIGNENCMKSDAALGKYSPDGPIIKPCLSCGLWDAGASIMVGGHHIATWLVGQVRNESQSEEVMRTHARKIGADEEAFIKAYNDIPQMSHERFEAIARSVFIMANQLSNSAYQNLQQARFIAEQEKAEKELHRLSTVIEQSPENVIITDTHGIIQYVNPVFETTTGYTREEAIGQTPNILRSGRQDKTFYERLWKTLREGKAWQGHLINQQKSGDLYTVEAIILPVRAPSGVITGYASIERDITKELLHEEKLRQSQKMEAIGQLAGGIAHDFNNILQAILGFSELLLLDLDLTAIGPRDQVAGIQKAAKHAAELTRQLLAFSRKQVSEVIPLDLNQIIKNTITLTTSLIGENIQLKVLLSEEPLPVMADARQIERTILNMVLNARDAMPEGGDLTLETGMVSFTQEDADLNYQVQAGDFARLMVSDTGTGMSPHIMEHIFEPFFTTKGPSKGTGLGLSAIYGIIQEHGGWISVYSEPEEGSTFKMHLPLRSIANNTHRIESPPCKALEITGEGQHILLVEDDPTVREMTMHVLYKAGYVVTSFATAEEAEALFTDHSDKFSMLISDVILPKKNGAELAIALTAKNPQLPVILCSGYSGDRIKKQQIEQNNFLFLEKPFSIIDLLAAVMKAFNA